MDKNIQNTSTIIEYEKKLLTAVRSRLTSEIRNLLKDNGNFVQNLQTLNNDISRKLEDVSVYMKDAVETACKYRLEECNSLRENLGEINEHINCMFLNQKQMVKDYKVFGKVYYVSFIFDDIFTIQASIIQISYSCQHSVTICIFVSVEDGGSFARFYALGQM